MARTTDRAAPGGATLAVERQFWTMADGLRGHMDAAEHKHAVLGLIFLKYISDAFAERYDQRDGFSTQQGCCTLPS